jgi:hypothetical protein
MLDSSDLPRDREPLPRIEWNPGASLRWLMVLILLGIAVFFAILHRREVAAWIRDCVAVMKGWFVREASGASETLLTRDGSSETVSKRFVDYPDPFAMYSGDPDRTVKALFDATCLWGQEHRVVRREDETPEEFVSLGRKYAPIEEGLSRLGMVYSRLAYAQKHAAPGDIQVLQTLWEWMVQHPPRSGPSGVILK